jgi:hypothetical protein
MSITRRGGSDEHGETADAAQVILSLDILYCRVPAPRLYAVLFMP